MPEMRPAFQYATLAQQHEAALLGMWTFLATELLFFGGLILAYCAYRHAYPGAFAEAARHTKIVIGSVNTALLLTSSFLVAWAVAGAKAGLRRLPATLLVIASLVGCAFLALKGYEYRQEFQEHLLPGIDFQFDAGQTQGAELFFVFYFIVTGLHGVHVTIGIAVLLTVAWRTDRGAYGIDYHAPLTSAGLYWHLVDVVWIFLYALIYLPGRSGA